MFVLRPATEIDYELLWEIQRSAIGPYVDLTWGWDEARQRCFFDEHFDHRRFQIIRVRKEDGGFLSFETRADHLYLANLALLSPYQSRGIGTAVMESVIRTASEKRLPIRLQVLKSNPADRFYERLGFERSGESTTHIRMRRDPDGADGGAIR